MYQASNASTTLSHSNSFVSLQQQQQQHQQNSFINNHKQYELDSATNEQAQQQQLQQQQYFQVLELETANSAADRLYETTTTTTTKDDSLIPFAFDEIGAIINSKDFEESRESPDQKQQQHQPFQYDDAHEYPPSSNVSQLLAVNNQQAGFKYMSLSVNNNNNNQQQQQQQQQAVASDPDQFYDDNSYQQLQQHQLKSEDNYEHIKVSFYENNSPPMQMLPQQQRQQQQQQDNNNMATTARASPQNNKSAYLFNAFDDKSRPYVEIVEQPAKCAMRFRYKCEGRSAGSLPGVNSTVDNKTFPSIRISNYIGRAVVVISCVTKELPYKAHPHNIVGKEGCKKGICTIVINNDSNTIRSFSSLGIQCVKRKDIEESLTLRESINVDPFRNGFAHKLCASNIDLNVVRLCFQVFIEGSTPNKCDVPLTPVVSDPIHDKKAMSDLVITKLSHCSAPVTGGREVILLCDRISKDDIQIRFYEERDGKLIWETYSELSPNDIHKQVAICFKTPKYYNENITQPVMVRIQLKRVSDNQVSEPRLFQFLPCESDEDIISRKRQKIEWVNMNHYALGNILQPSSQHPQHHIPMGQAPSPHHSNLQQKAHACPVAHQHHHQHHHQPDTPSPLQPQRSPPIIMNRLNEPQPTATTSRPTSHPQGASKQTPSSTETQQQQQQSRFIIESQNLVVRREIIDNEGRVMRLVDRPSGHPDVAQQEVGEGGNQAANRALGSSLDRIDTTELMRDMTFNSNMDFNLGSSLSLHLNGAEIMAPLDQQPNHLHATTSSRAREISCQISNNNKNC